MADTKYISSIKLSDGSEYAIKDAEAREILLSLFSDEVTIDCSDTNTSETNN